MTLKVAGAILFLLTSYSLLVLVQCSLSDIIDDYDLDAENILDESDEDIYDSFREFDDLENNDQEEDDQEDDDLENNDQEDVDLEDLDDDLEDLDDLPDLNLNIDSGKDVPNQLLYVSLGGSNLENVPSGYRDNSNDSSNGGYNVYNGEQDTVLNQQASEKQNASLLSYYFSLKWDSKIPEASDDPIDVASTSSTDPITDFALVMNRDNHTSATEAQNVTVHNGLTNNVTTLPKFVNSSLSSQQSTLTPENVLGALSDNKTTKDSTDVIKNISTPAGHYRVNQTSELLKNATPKSSAYAGYNLTVQEGDSATMSCNYTIQAFNKTNPVTWKIPINDTSKVHSEIIDTVIKSFSNGSILHTSSLMLKTVNFEAQGRYYCINDVTKEETVFDLDILARQSIHVVQKTDGHGITLNCTVVSRHNKSDIIWTKDDVFLSSGYFLNKRNQSVQRKYTFHSQVNIPNPKQADSGVYKCSDRIADLSDSITVKVKSTEETSCYSLLCNYDEICAFGSCVPLLSSSYPTNVFSMQDDDEPSLGNWYDRPYGIAIFLIIFCTILFIVVVVIVLRVYRNKLRRSALEETRSSTLWPGPPPPSLFDKPPTYDQSTSNSDSDAPYKAPETTGCNLESPPPSYSSGTSHQIQIPEQLTRNTSMPDLTTFQPGDSKASVSTANGIGRSNIDRNASSENDLLQTAGH